MEIEQIKNRIELKKEQLEKYKQDIEQVILFGIDREDYQEKIKLCREIIKELRGLENQLEIYGRNYK